MSWEGSLAMGVGMLVLWGSVIAGVMLLVRTLGHRRDVDLGPAGPSAALHILDERFARGEVDPKSTAYAAGC